MKKHFEEYGAGYIFIVIIVVLLFLASNWIYCQIRYWNTPYLEVPNHCHFRNK